jgi:adrenodoxin-NADP+ reductase
VVPFRYVAEFPFGLALLIYCQAAFTIKEIRELMKLPGVAFHPMDPSLMPTDMSQLSRPRSRIMKLLAGGSENKVDEVPMSWSLDYKLSPTSFNAHSSSPSRLSSMTFEANSLPPDSYDMAAKATGTGEIINLPADIAFRSIGYKSEALPGFEDLGISFDDRRGIILNDQMGRVLHSQAGLSGHVVLNHVPGMYCAGWVKRGPTGVIASTMADAFSTADVIAEDWLSHVPFIKGSSGESQKHGWEGLKEEAKKRGLRRVTWQDWKKIDQAERSKGKAIGKEREKFTGISDMLAVVD